jgi:hypothetical protein
MATCVATPEHENPAYKAKPCEGVLDLKTFICNTTVLFSKEVRPSPKSFYRIKSCMKKRAGL